MRSTTRRGSAAVVATGIAVCCAVLTARADTITLDLSAPQYCACGWVSINGYVASDGQLRGLVWDWGDGTRTTSWFPAAHRYGADGDYTVTVTAVGCTTEVELAAVSVSGVTEPGCPTEASPDCYAFPCRYVHPPNVHLTSGTTTEYPLEILDSSGDPVSGTTAFTPGDGTLVSVTPDGYVTGLRTETPSEIGTWMAASIDGRNTANQCVARVLPSDYGVAFIEDRRARTSLYYPMQIDGEDLDALVQQFEIPTVNEYAYTIQSELIGTTPFDGCRQIFEVDLGVSEEGRVCGISGNPIRLGWNVEGNAWQNCFMVPFLPPRSPQWSVFHHELGHNFTWSAVTFAQGLGTYHYSEGLATAMSLATSSRLLDGEARFPAGLLTRNSIQYLHDRDTTAFLAAFDNWSGAGANFVDLSPDIVDGIWLHHAGADISRFAGRFFAPLYPGHLDAMGGVLCAVADDGDRHTLFAALVSAAVGSDLSSTFADAYNYPIDGPLFAQALAAATGVIEAFGAGEVPGDGSWPGIPVTANKNGGDLILTWGGSCRPGDGDYAVYEGRLGEFYSHAARLCTTGGATSVTLSPAAGSAYYLVVPKSSSREGSYGRDDSGVERPQGGAACAVQLTAGCS